jgi:hypothetical protein
MQPHDESSLSTHIDPDTLALLALGEPVASSLEREHLAACGLCSGELAELGAAARLARDSISVEPLAVPSADVWSRIQVELHLGDAAKADADAADEADEAMPARDPRGTPAIPLRARRRWPVLLAAAASIVVLVAAATVGWLLLRPVPPRVLASTTLEALPAWPEATGEAVVERLPDGERVVRVTLDAPPTPGDYREAWLLTEDATDLVSLGVMSDSPATFAVPEGIDLAEFDLVDVSAEPTDGDPAHSGDSIVRGRLSVG